MKTKITVAFCILLGGFFLVLKNVEEKSRVSALEKEKQALNIKVQSYGSVQNSNDLTFTDRQQKQLNKMWNDFKVFQYSGSTEWFQHKGFYDNNLKDSIQVIIKQDGSLGLISNYFGAQPINHYQIQIKVGDTKIDSVKVHQLDNEVLGKTTQVHESLLLEEVLAKKLIEKIAKNYQSEIEVTLIGARAFKRFKLDQKQKNAFKESWALHKLMTI